MRWIPLALAAAFALPLPLVAAAPTDCPAEARGGETKNAARIEDRYVLVGAEWEVWREDNGVDGLQETARWCWDPALSGWWRLYRADDHEGTAPAPTVEACVSVNGIRWCL